MARTLVLAGKIGPAFGRTQSPNFSNRVLDTCTIEFVGATTFEQRYERPRPARAEMVWEGYEHRNAFKDGEPTIATLMIRQHRGEQIERMLGYVACETGTYSEYANALIERDSKAIAERKAIEEMDAEEHVCGEECHEEAERNAAVYFGAEIEYDGSWS